MEIVPTPVVESHQERRRLPRLALASEQFRLTRGGKIFLVQDLSIAGLGLRLLDSIDQILFALGSTVEGTLKLQDQRLTIQAKVTHTNAHQIGLQILGLSQSQRSTLEAFLNPTYLAKFMIPLPPSQGAAAWYHGPMDTSLLVWKDSDGKFERFSLSLLGGLVQSDANHQTSTGRFLSGHEPVECRGVVEFETRTIEFDCSPSELQMGVAKSFFLSSNLPQDLVSWCLTGLGK